MNRENLLFIDFIYNIFQVILVRHPFSRLVSAYYDKLTNFKSPEYAGVSQHIHKFYYYLRHNESERHMQKNGLASFEDFVNFLVRLKNFDNHWKPFHIRCSPCVTKYDYIAKFETFNNDMEYLKQKINLTKEHREYFFTKKQYKTNFELMKKTFEKIPKKLAYRLYEVYRDDFEMFGYSLPDWMC